MALLGLRICFQFNLKNQRILDSTLLRGKWRITKRKINTKTKRSSKSSHQVQGTERNKGLLDSKKFVFVRTCVRFWEDLPNGVMFDTAYLDSREISKTTNSDAPVILALHDTPGSPSDLVPILQPFCNLGYRVIIPEFPGLGDTCGVGPYDDNIFTGQTDERTDFIRNFMLQLRLERVDLLLGHGSGCLAAMNLCNMLRKTNRIGSLGLINPIGHRNSRPIEYAAVKEFATLWDQKPLLKLPLYFALLVACVTRLKFLKQMPFLDWPRLLLTFAGFRYDLVLGDLASLEEYKIPKLMIYTKGERLFVNDDIMLEYADYLGINESNFYKCDNTGRMIKPESYNENFIGAVFDDKPESLFGKYKGQVTLTLNELLNYVLKK